MYFRIKKYGILIQRSSSINHFKGLKENRFPGIEVTLQKQWHFIVEKECVKIYLINQEKLKITEKRAKNNFNSKEY